MGYLELGYAIPKVLHVSRAMNDIRGLAALLAGSFATELFERAHHFGGV